MKSKRQNYLIGYVILLYTSIGIEGSVRRRRADGDFIFPDEFKALQSRGDFLEPQPYYSNDYTESDYSQEQQFQEPVITPPQNFAQAQDFRQQQSFSQGQSPQQGFSQQFSFPQQQNFPQQQDFRQQQGFPQQQQQSFLQQQQGRSQQQNFPFAQDFSQQFGIQQQQDFPQQQTSFLEQFPQEQGRQQGFPQSQETFQQRNPDTSTTPMPIVTTPSPAFLACIANCPTTSEYNPICGTNRQLYSNEQKFNCALGCGAQVEIWRRGSCEGLFDMMRG